MGRLPHNVKESACLTLAWIHQVLYMASALYITPLKGVSKQDLHLHNDTKPIQSTRYHMAPNFYETIFSRTVIMLCISQKYWP